MPDKPVTLAKFWLRSRVPLGFLAAAWYLSLVQPASALLLAASTIWTAAGCGLRSWAAGYLLKGKRVATGGPYAYVRNPLYLGSFLIGFGFAMALYQVLLPPSVAFFWMIALAGFLSVYRAKTLAEEKELAASLGPAYETYRKRVPAFLPLRGKVRGLGLQRFSWELYRRNREYRCVLGSALMAMFLIWRTLHGS